MGVRPTQLTIKKPAFHKFRPDYDLFQNFKICMNIEMCEMCRPDTHALQIIYDEPWEPTSWALL